MNQVMSELTVAGGKYRCGKLNAMQQFHVTRRLGPMLVVAGISVEMIQRGMKMELDDMVAMAGPVMDCLAKMSDADVDYCVYTCMRAVQRLQGDSAWADVLAPDGKSWMFADLDMPALIRLVLEVLKHNLGNFLPELGGALTSPSSSGGSGQSAEAGK